MALLDVAQTPTARDRSVKLTHSQDKPLPLHPLSLLDALQRPRLDGCGRSDRLRQTFRPSLQILVDLVRQVDGSWYCRLREIDPQTDAPDDFGVVYHTFDDGA